MSKTSLDKNWQDEIKKGKRFKFGKNWKNFLKKVNSKNINESKARLSEWLGSDLSNLKFIDVGSGSGLSSLSAVKLGSDVLSFDYDSDSVECTQLLKKLKASKNGNWEIMQGSILDKTFLNNLGRFDIVYSWGVLHHTGSMWEAITNACNLVNENGKIFISIYNEQDNGISHKWLKVKKKYNYLFEPFKSLYLIFILLVIEKRSFISHLRNNSIKDYISYRLNYNKSRGMSYFSDVIDWIGGYPYEFAKGEKIISFIEARGFSLIKSNILSAANYGCNEFLFRKKSGS
tara:strand:- start:9599 stop:10462 length:864 start_codon:yes stop_codon:yes gene_type:complete